MTFFDLLNNILDYCIIYYNIIFLCIYIRINIKKVNKVNYIVVLLLIFLYFLIKPFLITLLLTFFFTILYFLYKKIKKAPIYPIQYITIEKWFHLIINIYIYKYNSIFNTMYKNISYNSKNNIGIKNTVYFFIRNIFNIMLYLIIGIPKVYLKTIINIATIISKSIDMYLNMYIKKKTIFIIFFLSYEEIINFFNTKILEENFSNSKNIIYTNKNEKNGNFTDFIILTIKNPKIILSYPELKNKFDIIVYNNIKCEEEINNKNFYEENFHSKLGSVLAGNKNNPKILHYSVEPLNTKKDIEIQKNIVQTFKKKIKETPAEEIEAIIKKKLSKQDFNNFCKNYKNLIESNKIDLNKKNQNNIEDVD